MRYICPPMQLIFLVPFFASLEAAMAGCYMQKGCGHGYAAISAGVYHQRVVKGHAPYFPMRCTETGSFIENWKCSVKHMVIA